MNRDAVIRILQPHLGELADRYGVKSLALFGSVARDEATAESDVDLLVEFGRPMGLFGLFTLQDPLEKLLYCSVDLGTRDSLNPCIRSQVLAECIDVP